MENENKTVQVPGYYSILRPEIMSRIPEAAKTILDIGCGAGALGKALKNRQPCTVDGLELNHAAFRIAESEYDNCYQGNIDTFSTAGMKGPYDVIVFADILEHCIDPWGALQKYSYLLQKNGLIIASIPNIAHPAIRHELDRGLFRYAGAGILDGTHLRFFTKTTIMQMFAQADLKIKKIEAHPAEQNPIQYIITAKKASLKYEKPIVKIIMPVCNALEYTKQAIESIRENTDCWYKLIVIDNGSRDDMQRYLEDQDDVLHIRNDNMLGFPTACNLGLSLVETPYFAIVNSDIIVTKNWLTDMIEALNSNEKYGLIGPMSNYVSGQQQEHGTTYRSRKELEIYAEERKKQIGTQLQSWARLVFFCVVSKSELLGKIGLLDEGFGIGNYEDDDYCIRASQAGYEMVIDRRVFIHHAGHKTFIENKIDYAQAMEKAKARFIQKHSLQGNGRPGQ